MHSPWSNQVLIRAPESPKRAPTWDYSVEIAQDLEQVLLPFIQPHLRATYGVDETPLVFLPGISAALGKPVYLFREALLPTGSSKPRMLAALFDLYLNGDPQDLTGLSAKPLPTGWGTQSTGNHLLALAWGASQMRKRTEPNGHGLDVLGFTMAGIPVDKKEQAEQFGATVLDRFQDYGKARTAMDQEAQQEPEGFLRWNHGDRPVILGNMTAAVQLTRQVTSHPELKDKRIALISATGAGGRVAGWVTGMAQLMPGRAKVVAAETTRVPPAFLAAKEGKPVPIRLPAKRVWEDGIAVDQMEPEALELFLAQGDAVALVDPEEGLAYTRWLLEELAQIQAFGPPITEVVTGVSLAVAFRHPKLFEEAEVLILDETGMNIDQADLEEVKAIALPNDYWKQRIQSVLTQRKGQERVAIAQLWKARHQLPFELTQAHEDGDQELVEMILDLDLEVGLGLLEELTQPTYPVELAPDFVAHAFRWPEVRREYLLPTPQDEKGRLDPLDLLLARQLIEKLAEAPDLDVARAKLFQGEFQVTLKIPWDWIRRLDLRPALSRQQITLHDFFQAAMERAGYSYLEKWPRTRFQADRLSDQLKGNEFSLWFGRKSKGSMPYQNLFITFFPQLRKKLEKTAGTPVQPVGFPSESPVVTTAGLEEREPLSDDADSETESDLRRQTEALEYLKGFSEARSDPVVFQQRWRGLTPYLPDLSEILVSGNEDQRFDLIRRLARLPIPLKPTAGSQAVRGILLDAMDDTQPLRIRHFVRNYWARIEQNAWRGLNRHLSPLIEGQRYLVEYHLDLMEGADFLQLENIEAEFMTAAKQHGAEIHFSRYDSRRTSVTPGTKRVTLLTTGDIGGFFPRHADHRALAVQWNHRPESTRLFSRAFLLALAIASLPEDPAEDDPVLIALKRYYQALGIRASTQDLKDLATSGRHVEEDGEVLQAVLERLTVNLTAVALEPLLREYINHFLKQLQLDLLA